MTRHIYNLSPYIYTSHWCIVTTKEKSQQLLRGAMKYKPKHQVVLIIETIVLLFPLASGAEEHSHKSSTTALGTDCLDFLIKSLFFKLKKNISKNLKIFEQAITRKSKRQKNNYKG